MSGATGRLWVNENGGRLELQSDAGDAQIVWSDTKVTVYDATSNTAYVADLPQKTGSSPGATTHTVPTLDEITTFLTDLGKHWTVSGAEPSNVAGQEAYTVTVSPSHDGGLLGSAELAWDARARRAAEGRGLRAGLVLAGARARGDERLLRRRSELRRSGLAARRREDRRPLVADGQRHVGRRFDAAGHRPRCRAGRGAVRRRRAGHARRPAAPGRAPRRSCRLPVGDRGLRPGARRDRRRRAQAGRDEARSGGHARRTPVGLARRRDRARARDAARHGPDLGSRRRLVRARRLAPSAAAEAAARSLK